MRELVPIRKSKSVFDEIDRMHDRIMRRAYDIFTSNGGFFGKDIDDWMCRRTRTGMETSGGTYGEGRYVLP